MLAERIVVLRNIANAPKDVTREEIDGRTAAGLDLDVSTSRARSRAVRVRMYVTMVTPSYDVWQ